MSSCKTTGLKCRQSKADFMQIDRTDIEDPVILALVRENMDVIEELFPIIESYGKKGVCIDIVLDLYPEEEDAMRGYSIYHLTLAILSSKEERLQGTVREWDHDQDQGFVTFKP